MDRLEEQDLYRRMKCGDNQARDELILQHEPLVHRIASRYRDSDDYDDIVQEGFLGLMTAVDKYDISKGRLHIYAKDYIHRSIEDFLNRMRYPVSMPRAHYYAIHKLTRLRSQLEQKRKRQLTKEDLIEEEIILEAHVQFQETYNSKISIGDFVSLITYSEETYSLNPDLELLDPESDSPMSRMELQDLISHLISSLTKQEQFVIQSLAAGRSRSSIAAKLKVDVKRVSRIKYRAKKKIEDLASQSEEIRTVLDSYGITI